MDEKLKQLWIPCIDLLIIESSAIIMMVKSENTDEKIFISFCMTLGFMAFIIWILNIEHNKETSISLKWVTLPGRIAVAVGAILVFGWSFLLVVICVYHKYSDHQSLAKDALSIVNKVSVEFAYITICARFGTVIAPLRLPEQKRIIFTRKLMLIVFIGLAMVMDMVFSCFDMDQIGMIALIMNIFSVLLVLACIGNLLITGVFSYLWPLMLTLTLAQLPVVSIRIYDLIIGKLTGNYVIGLISDVAELVLLSYFAFYAYHTTGDGLDENAELLVTTNEERQEVMNEI